MVHLDTRIGGDPDIVRIDLGVAQSCDRTLIAVQSHIAQTLIITVVIDNGGVADVTGQDHIVLAGDIDVAAAVTIAQEADTDTVISLQAGSRGTGRTLLARPVIIGSAIAEDLAGRAVIPLISRNFRKLLFVSRIMAGADRKLRAVVARSNDRTGSQTLAAAGISGKLILFAFAVQPVYKIAGIAVIQKSPEQEFFTVAVLFRSLAGNAAGPLILQSALRIIGIAAAASRPCRQLVCSRTDCITALLAVHIFSDLIGVFISNTDQPADIIISDRIDFDRTVDGHRIDTDIRSAVHRHQPAVAGAGDFTGDIDLTAVRRDAVGQQLFGRRIVINLDLIIPDLGRTVPDLATAVDAVSIIAHDLVIAQRPLVGCPTGIQGRHFTGVGSRQFCRIAAVAALYQTADIHVQPADINVVTCYDTGAFVRRIIQFAAIDAYRLDQPVDILVIAVESKGFALTQLIKIILDLFRYRITELVTGDRVAADIDQTFAAGLRYRTVDGRQRDIAAADITLYQHVVIIIVDDNIAGRIADIAENTDICLRRRIICKCRRRIAVDCDLRRLRTQSVGFDRTGKVVATAGVLQVRTIELQLAAGIFDRQVADCQIQVAAVIYRELRRALRCQLAAALQLIGIDIDIAA